MPKKTIPITGWTELQPGDVVVRKGTSFGIEVEREVPLPEVRVGDVIRWYYSDSYTDTDKQGSSELDTVLGVTGDRITFTDGGFIWRDHTRAIEPSQPYEVYRKVEE